MSLDQPSEQASASDSGGKASASGSPDALAAEQGESEETEEDEIRPVDATARRGDAPTVAFTMGHPAQVHLFRNAIRQLAAEGYRVYVFVREKEMLADLLDAHDIPYNVLLAKDAPDLSFDGPQLLEVGIAQALFEYRLLRAARKIDPDLLVAEVGVAGTHVAKATGAKSLVFAVSEHANLQNRLAFPFADRICTPTCYWDDLGVKQSRYPGYHQLAYLHPDRFEPDPSVLEVEGIDPDEKFVVLRTVGWNSAHDVGSSGFDGLREVIDELEQTGARVLVTSEEPLPDDLASYELTVAPEDIYHLMHYADCFVGESATMATESAVLGTPAVYVSTLEVGYTHELEAKYGLVFNFAGEDRQQSGLEKATEILDGTLDADWEARRDRLLEDKRDTTDVIVEQVRQMTRQEPTATREGWR